MVIDYRKLNEIMIRDAYPLPNMEQLLETAWGAKVFSKFDLKSAYNLIRLCSSDKWKTAFVTPWDYTTLLLCITVLWMPLHA
jgi:hypothetical protein